MSDSTPTPAAPLDPAQGPPARPTDDLPSVAPVTTRRRRWPSIVWLVPAVALLVGISLLVQAVLQKGPTVTIEFRTAEGLTPGKTEVRYKEVSVGRVETVRLSKDRRRVQVTVQLDRSVSSIAVADTRFWVVRPRIGTGGVSGLGTLLSGAYIGVDAGTSEEAQTSFTGLETAPLVLRGEPGRSYVLRAPDLGSLDVGSPVFYRRVRVGRVVGYTLDAEADLMSIQIFVEAPYDRLVTATTRFWNASGVDLTLNANGLTLNTQTLASVIEGGIAFERAPGDTPLPAADSGSHFFLYDDRKSAIAPPTGPPMAVRMVFDQSVRGLTVDAPLDFLGIEVGTVRSVRLDYDRLRKRYPVVVEADLYPLRLRAVRNASGGEPRSENNPDQALLRRLVERGLRAQLRTGNLLTGQLYVALDFIAKDGGNGVELVGGTPTIPTVPGTLNELQQQVAEIVARISKLPLEEIGQDLRGTLAGVQQTLAEVRRSIGTLTPEAQRAMDEVRTTLGSVQSSLAQIDRNLVDPSAPVQRNVEQTMAELQRAAQSMRVLMDYLQRHPDALLRGKQADPPLPTTEAPR